MVNDNYGHSVGDKVLRAVAELLEALVREIDIVARIGGEEFAFVLPETSLIDAGVLAERIRSEVENLVVIGTEHEIRLTASIGVATCTDGVASLEALLSNADGALYAAKRNGRNQIRNANESD